MKILCQEGRTELSNAGPTEMKGPGGGKHCNLDKGPLTPHRLLVLVDNEREKTTNFYFVFQIYNPSAAPEKILVLLAIPLKKLV